MRFKVITSVAQLPLSDCDVCYLIHSSWDDWYEFETKFALYYYDSRSVRTYVGEVKIGKKMMVGESQEEYNRKRELGEDVSMLRRTQLPNAEFDKLTSEYFSLGTTDSYYEFLGYDEGRRRILEALRDVASDISICDEVNAEQVFTVSLSRGISRDRISRCFHNLANGRRTPTPFAFSYKYPDQEGRLAPVLNFVVTPDSYPPSNIKIVIGRNGVGKTHLLRNIAKGLSLGDGNSVPGGPRNESRCGQISFSQGRINGIVFASLSPFEEFELSLSEFGADFHCIGSVRYNDEQNRVEHSEDFEHSFVEQLSSCRASPRRERWLRAVKILKSDPVLARLDAERLLDFRNEEFEHEAMSFFGKLSSGHRALFLLVTQLVCILDESYLVLLDEPECHLHPPLLASFVRCLSELLSERNAVAIIATHSPQILQEVSKESVWILSRYGHEISARNPTAETFGENTSILMTEVFDLEMEESGYHKILKKVVDEGLSYDDIMFRFDGRLGLEAKALLRVLIAHRDA